MKKRIFAIFCFVIMCLVSLVACVGNDNDCKHTLNKVEYAEPTCTVDGNIEYWKCSKCNKKFEDEECAKEITNVVLPAAGHKIKSEYDFDTKQYEACCLSCNYKQTVNAGTSEYPLLVRDETELNSVVDNAEKNSFIKLNNDILVTTGGFEVITRLPDGGTLDLGGHTVTVQINCGFVVEGTDVTLQNGTVNAGFETEGYALFIGDIGENNKVIVKNINSNGGFNIFNCEATLYDCNVDASERTYYALWADEHAVITVESGTYYGGKTACVHSTVGPVIENEDSKGIIIFNGGEFQGKIIATDYTVINGGSFDGEIIVTRAVDPDTNLMFEGKLLVNKDYDKDLIIKVDSEDKRELITFEEDGYTVYQTKDKE